MANINKNIIMQAGAAVANATNKAAGLSAATPEPGSIISAIQLVNGGRELGPASLLHFTESVRNKLLSLLVTMEPIQDFNGYDHPWPAGGGVNILDPDKSSRFSTSAYGMDITYLGDDTFTIKGQSTTTSANAAFNVLKYSDTSLGGLGYVVQAFIVNDKNNNYKSCHGLRTSNEKEIAVVLNCSVSQDVDITLKFSVATASQASWTPYSNICPISGRTGLNGYIGPTDSIGDAATYSMDWTSPAGTVYAGIADIVSGDIKAAPYYASYNGETLVGPWVSSMDVYDPEGTPTTGAQVVDLGGTMTGYHITGQDIITLVGDNYIWSDSGDVTITE